MAVYCATSVDAHVSYDVLAGLKAVSDSSLYHKTRAIRCESEVMIHQSSNVDHMCVHQDVKCLEFLHAAKHLT